MSTELERRLEGMLAAVPDPDARAGEEALARALSAVRPAGGARRGLRAGLVVFATVAVLLAIAAGSLAAAGALHVSFGAKKEQQPAITQLSLPNGAHGIAAIVDGRLSVVTKSGFRLQGLPATAAALSPHALYVAAGIGDSVVAMKPDGRQVWSHPAGGRIVAISWAPDAIRIAYVVQRGRRLALHVIWGTGTHDTTIDRSVRAVRPSWRADSLALAYVGAGGSAVVYDIGHRSHRIVRSTARVTRLAFAPVGSTLLVATADSAILAGKKVADGKVETIGWFYGRPAIALAMTTTARIRAFGPAGRLLDDFVVPGTVVALTDRLVVTETHDRVLAGWGREKTVNTLLKMRAATSVDDLAIG